MECNCKHEGEIATMIENIKDLKKAVFGNGRKGLQQELTTLNENVRLNNEINHELRTAISGISKVQTEIDTEKTIEKEMIINQREEMRLRRTKIYQTITIALSAAGIIIAFLAFVMK